jgi:hypothetical protein
MRGTEAYRFLRQQDIEFDDYQRSNKEKNESYYKDRGDHIFCSLVIVCTEDEWDKHLQEKKGHQQVCTPPDEPETCNVGHNYSYMVGYNGISEEIDCVCGRCQKIVSRDIGIESSLLLEDW